MRDQGTAARSTSYDEPGDCSAACVDCGCHDRFDQLAAVTRRWERRAWSALLFGLLAVVEAVLYTTGVL